MKYIYNFKFFIIVVTVLVTLLTGHLDIFAQKNERNKNNKNKEVPIPTDSIMPLPDEFKDNYPYNIDVRFYVSGNYKDRQLIATIPLKIGERVRGNINYDSTSGRINVYVKGNLVGTELVRPWNKLLPKITYGYGVKFEPKESGRIDFLFTPQISASSVDEYEVFNEYDPEWGSGIKIYHRRK